MRPRWILDLIAPLVCLATIEQTIWGSYIVLPQPRKAKS